MPSSKIIPIRNALAELDRLDGELVQVEGTLDLERDRFALCLDPADARQTDDCEVYIRLTSRLEHFNLEDVPLAASHGKRVQAFGILRKAAACRTDDGRPGPAAELDVYMLISSAPIITDPA